MKIPDMSKEEFLHNIIEDCKFELLFMNENNDYTSIEENSLKIMEKVVLETFDRIFPNGSEDLNIYMKTKEELKSILNCKE